MDIFTFPLPTEIILNMGQYLYGQPSLRAAHVQHEQPITAGVNKDISRWNTCYKIMGSERALHPYKTSYIKQAAVQACVVQIMNTGDVVI